MGEGDEPVPAARRGGSVVVAGGQVPHHGRQVLGEGGALRRRRQPDVDVDRQRTRAPTSRTARAANASRYDDDNRSATRAGSAPIGPIANGEIT
jgi:hypothetical protein